MDKLVQLVHRIGAVLLLFLTPALPALAAPNAGGRMVFVADGRRFTGWRAWIVGLYNESHLYFALVTILAIPLLGVILGKLTDAAMARLGINLKSRVLAEH